jgi:hypothetical protein
MARILHTLPTTFFLSNWISEINKQQQQKNGVCVCVCVEILVEHKQNKKITYKLEHTTFYYSNSNTQRNSNVITVWKFA